MFPLLTACRQLLRLFGLLLVLVSWGSANGALTPLRLQLKWQHQFQFAGYYAAIEQGYYRNVGLDVTLLEPTEGVSELEAVLTGRAEVGIQNSDLLLHWARGRPVVALATIFQHSPQALMAIQGRGIDSLHDIIGKQISLEPSSAELIAYLNAEGINIDQLKIQDCPPSVADLVEEKVAAISVYSTDEPFLLEQAGIPYQIYSPRAAGIDFYSDILFTSQNYLTSHPQQIRRFIEASLQGWRYALRNQSEIVELILKKYSQRHSREHLEFEAHHTERLILPEVVTVGFMNPGRWQHIAETYRGLGMLSSEVNLDGFLYNPDPQLDYARLRLVLMVSLLVGLLAILVGAHYWRLYYNLRQEETKRRATQLQLSQALDQAESANRAKSAFVANMSHEMRTPLTAILGFTQTLLEPDQSSAQRDWAIHAVLDNSRHLRDLIDDILDLSKIEAGRLEVEMIPVDLPELLGGIGGALQNLAQAKDLDFVAQFIPPLPKKIVSDPTRLRQILLNLGGNAIKFTERGAVRLLVSCDPATQLLIMTIMDTGIGLEASQIERLFQPFVQADSSITRRHGGTGLGLYISRKLTQNLGGDLRLESHGGVGSVFIATLATGPLDSQEFLNQSELLETLTTRKEDGLTAPQVAGRILLAEDNPYNQALLSHYLAHTGAEVVIVGNGEEAVARAMEEEFHLILMDMQMPLMDGLKATHLLRQALCPTPIVALTAHSMAIHRQEAAEAGCNGFLTKPVDWVALYQTVATYLPPATGAAQDVSLSSHRLSLDVDLDELATRFRESLPTTLVAINEALSAEDLAKVADLAHQIKGVAGAFGFSAVGSAARELEIAARNGEGPKIAATLAKLTSVCQ